MRRGTSRKPTTDDQRSFHLELPLTELIEKGFIWCHFVGNQTLKKSRSGLVALSARVFMMS